MSRQSSAEGRHALLEGLKQFALHHGLSTGTDVATLTRKFLIVSANGVDIEKAYPLIADDLATVQYRVGAKQPLYRSSTQPGYTYPPEMWEYLFSQSEVGDFAPVELGGSDDIALEGYRHFKAQLNAKSARFRELAEWQKLLGFYMGAQIHRNANTVCREVLGMNHTGFQDELNTLRPSEKAAAMAAVVGHMTFAELEEPEFRMVLRNPERAHWGDKVYPGARSAENNGKGANPWDAPVRSIKDMVSSVPCAAPLQWNLAAQKAYREIPVVRDEADRVGEFSPLHMVFQALVGEPMTASGEKAEDPRLSASWDSVLGILDHASVDAAMRTAEMHDFLRQVASQIGTNDFQHWTARNAVKKLITIHAPSWRKKWSSDWELDEPLERAINAHMAKYSEPSQDFVRAIFAIDPRA
jgi:hypothetical protein